MDKDVLDRHRRTLEKAATHVARGTQVDPEELMTAGMVCLWQCLSDFDPAVGSFGGYVYTRACWAMRDELRRVQPYSRYRVDKARKFEQIREDLRQKLFREPTEDEVTAAGGGPDPDCHVPLSYLTGLEVTDPGQPSPVERASISEQHEKLQDWMDEHLDPIDKRCVELFHGHQLSKRDIERKLGIGINTCLKRVRRAMAVLESR